MPNEMFNNPPVVVLGSNRNGLTVSIPNTSVGGLSVGTISVPVCSGENQPIDLNFTNGVVVSLPSENVSTVAFPASSGNPPLDLNQTQGTLLIDLPQGGHLTVTIPNVQDKIRVNVKAARLMRVFTQAAAI